MKFEWYTVDYDGNFYDSMQGFKVSESEFTVTIEIPMMKSLGGSQTVQFYKDQLIYDGIE